MTASASASGDIPAEDAPPTGALYSFGTPWPEFNEGISYTDTFRCTGATTTLVEFYSTSYKSSAPLPGWIKRIRNGQITVDGEVATDPDMILREGSKLVYHRLPWQEPFAPHLLDVLYEDDDMIALNKPSGLQVLPKGLFQQRTVLAQLQLKDWKMPSSFCSKRKYVQSHPVPVHRLGRGTSGLLLCAKTKLAKAQLAAYFAEGATNAGKSRDETDFCKSRKILKFYRALVTGKPAMSKVCVLERLENHNQTLIQVEIHSGRPHQIRIHLSYIGHPLVDDQNHSSSATNPTDSRGTARYS
uniref:Pseudouridine synthase RsuA/RluA-like domain-containing protein n=1 Tax=Oryza punctata TaxID=4537 RepID=A0A0E0KCB8_ORYPU